MSRRIVQLTAIARDANRGRDDALFALDNNGVAWVLYDPCVDAKWARLPELPSLQNRPATVAKGASDAIGTETTSFRASDGASDAERIAELGRLLKESRLREMALEKVRAPASIDWAPASTDQRRSAFIEGLDKCRELYQAYGEWPTLEGRLELAEDAFPSGGADGEELGL